MGKRTYVTFNADFPDETVWDENDEIRIPGGKHIIDMIWGELGKSKFKITSPEQHSYYGWAFEIRDGDATMWLLLQGGDLWILMTMQQKSIIDTLRFRHYDSTHMSLNDRIHSFLSQNAHVENIKWYSEKEWEISPGQPGNPNPPRL